MQLLKERLIQFPFVIPYPVNYFSKKNYLFEIQSKMVMKNTEVNELLKNIFNPPITCALRT